MNRPDGRGKKDISPVKTGNNSQRSIENHPVFGMWSDREDTANVDRWIRRLRKGRYVLTQGAARLNEDTGI
jgi:hypothetical protein